MGDRKKTRTAARTTRAFRPRLETLGDRIVPATVFWTGAVNNLWSVPGNWTALPKDGDDLRFQATAPGNVTASNLANNNDLPNLRPSSITITDPGYVLAGNRVTLAGGGAATGITYTFNGSSASNTGSTVALPVTFSNIPQAITANSQSTNLTITGAITLAADLRLATVPTFSAVAGGTFNGQSAALTLTGNVLGTGNLTLGNVTNTQAGVVLMNSGLPNNFAGTTTVNSGTLFLQGGGSNGAGGSTITGNLVVGNDTLTDGAATVTVANNEQINDTSTVTVQSDGTLNIAFVNETIQNLNVGTPSGAGRVTATSGTSTPTPPGSGNAILILNGNLTANSINSTSQIDAVVNLLPTSPHTFTVNKNTLTTFTSPNLLLTNALQVPSTTVLPVTFTGGGKTELRGVSVGGQFPVVIANGELDLRGSFGTGGTGTAAGSILPGDVTIGDGSGQSAVLKLLTDNGIADTGVVTLSGANSVFDHTGTLFGETIGGLSGTDPNSQVLVGRQTLTIQPSVNRFYAGKINGMGEIHVRSPGSGGSQVGSQEFSGPINLSGNFFGTNGLSATAGGILVVDSPSVFGGVSTEFSTGGTISGTGLIDTLDAQFSNATDFIMPGTYPVSSAGAVATPSIFQPGTLSAQNLTLGATTLAIQINSATSYGQLRVTQGLPNNTFLDPTLRVTLPTGFLPTGGQAFTIVDIVPTGLILFSNSASGGIFGLFRDATTGLQLAEGDTFTPFNNNNTRFAISYRGGDGNDVVIFNTLAPTATVSTGTVSGNTVSFVATFSGPVGSINPNGVQVATTGDVAFSFVSSTRLTDTTYLITVNGVTGTGTVSISLDQGATFSGAGTPIQPSNTAQVNVNVANPVPPTPPTPIGNNGRSGGRVLVAAGAGGAGAANVYAGQPIPSQALSLPLPQFATGTRVATADFNRDGVADYVFATGPGQSAFFQVLDGQSGDLLFSAAPFGDFTGGLNVATGDLTRDGVADLVVTPDEGGGPRVIVFNGAGFNVLADFFGIADPNFRGGARAAIGDLNGDGFGDLVVSAGFGGGPRVAVYDGKTVPGGRPTKLINDFFVFEPGLRNGAYVAVVDVNGDGKGDLVAGGGPGGAPRVTVFDGGSLASGAVTQVTTFFAGNPDARGGIRLAAADYDGNGVRSLVTGAGAGDGSEVRVYVPANLVTSNPIPEAVFDAFPGFTGGVFVG